MYIVSYIDIITFISIFVIFVSFNILAEIYNFRDGYVKSFYWQRYNGYV